MGSALSSDTLLRLLFAALDFTQLSPYDEPAPSSGHHLCTKQHNTLWHCCIPPESIYFMKPALAQTRSHMLRLHGNLAAALRSKLPQKCTNPPIRVTSTSKYFLHKEIFTWPLPSSCKTLAYNPQGDIPKLCVIFDLEKCWEKRQGMCLLNVLKSLAMRLKGHTWAHPNQRWLARKDYDRN